MRVKPDIVVPMALVANIHAVAPNIKGPATGKNIAVAKIPVDITPVLVPAMLKQFFTLFTVEDAGDNTISRDTCLIS